VNAKAQIEVADKILEAVKNNNSAVLKLGELQLQVRVKELDVNSQLIIAGVFIITLLIVAATTFLPVCMPMYLFESKLHNYC